jgi:hypothetical protein
MFKLGLLYHNGQGVAQDNAKAVEWYEKAADKGYTDAMVNLGMHYANDLGVARDYAKAREWYEKAAAKDNATAMVNLAVLYHNGQGVARNYAKARELARQSRRQGQLKCQGSPKKIADPLARELKATQHRRPLAPVRPRRRAILNRLFLLRWISLVLAQSGHSQAEDHFPLSGVKRRFLQLASMSVVDPKRT